ncbi:MAG: hypothetical protein AB8G23_20485 [Myxococcota bacterium]
MNREILIALGGTLLALVLGYAVLESISSDAPAEPDSPLSSVSAAPPPNAPPPNAPAPLRLDDEAAAERRGAERVLGATDLPGLSDQATPLEIAEYSHSAAQEAHRLATRALEASESSLNEVEREIDAVERFIEDLEERGDDPADFAEEGMAKLRPAIERFEARLEVVEQDEQREAEARSRLDAAEAELTRLRTEAL